MKYNNKWEVKLDELYNSNDLNDKKGIMQAYDYVVVNSVFGSETYVVTFIPKFDDNTRVLEVFAPFTIEYPSVPGA